MKDPEINRIDGTILGMTRWMAQLSASQATTRCILEALSKTLTPEQKQIISQYDSILELETARALKFVEEVYSKLPPPDDIDSSRFPRN